MHFGFSYVGLIFLLMLFVPNSFWPKYPPQDYDKYVARESKVLLLFERIGQVTVTTAAVIFTDFNLKPWSLWWRDPPGHRIFPSCNIRQKLGARGRSSISGNRTYRHPRDP